MGMELPIRDSCLNLLTLPNFGIFQSCLCVKTMAMAWVPVLKGHLQVHYIIPEEIIFQEYGYVKFVLYTSRGIVKEEYLVIILG